MNTTDLSGKEELATEPTFVALSGLPETQKKKTILQDHSKLIAFYLPAVSPNTRKLRVVGARFYRMDQCGSGEAEFS